MRDVATFIAVNRFGLGAGPGAAEAVGGDPRGWAAAQIDRRAAPGTAGGRASAGTLAEMHRAAIEGPEQLRATARRLYSSVFWPEVVARARHAIETEQPFAERMALFWSNHFTVSRTRAIVGPAIPAYEREAIRPHVFGRFVDMLKAVCRHPCMLEYLDNIVSIGPQSDVGRRRLASAGDARTLNENLAREILELHTIGVNGGYGQQDVIELAKAISGWSHGGFRPRGHDPRPVQGDFEFRPVFHEPGRKIVLGRTYAEAGADEGLAILDDLARHPATAQHLATKLVRHFIADDPPADAVMRIARIFLASDGDLAAVSRALIDLDAVWREPLPKVKTHYEFVVAVHRAFGNATAGADVVAPLRTLGQSPFSASSPQGWGDTARDWIAPEALLRRIEWVRSLAGSLPATLHPISFLDDVVGPVAGDATREGVARAPSADAAIALVLSSAEFQRR